MPPLYLKEPVQSGNRRHGPAIRNCKSAAAGDIGKLEKLIITSRDPGLPSENILRASGGLFADMMIHDFDMARFVLGEEPVMVFAAGAALTSPLVKDIGDIDTAMVIMQTASGVLCTINCSRRAVYGYDQRIEAFGSVATMLIRQCYIRKPHGNKYKSAHGKNNFGSRAAIAFLYRPLRRFLPLAVRHIRRRRLWQMRPDANIPRRHPRPNISRSRRKINARK